MSNIWFASDFHLGHRNIHKMRPEYASAIENDDKLCAFWSENVTKRDTVYCLGDMAFDEAALTRMIDLPGRKILVKGNHDVSVGDGFELAVYDKILGLEKYKKMWLSHCPIHHTELRGKVNVHGHIHRAHIVDPRYFNICPESLGLRYGRPMITLVELRDWISERFPHYYTT